MGVCLYLDQAKEVSSLNCKRVEAILNVCKVLERKGEKLERELLDCQKEMKRDEIDINPNETVEFNVKVKTSKTLTFLSDDDGNQTELKPLYCYSASFACYLYYFRKLFNIDPNLHADWFYEYLGLPVPLQEGKTEQVMINILDLPEPIRVFVEACKYPDLRQDNFSGSAADYLNMLELRIGLLSKKYNVIHKRENRYYEGLSKPHFRTLKMLINYNQEEMLKKFYK